MYLSEPPYAGKYSFLNPSFSTKSILSTANVKSRRRFTFSIPTTIASGNRPTQG